MTDNFIFRSAVRSAPLRRLQEKLERPKKKSEHLVVYEKPRPVAKTFVVFKTGNKTKVILK